MAIRMLLVLLLLPVSMLSFCQSVTADESLSSRESRVTTLRQNDGSSSQVASLEDWQKKRQQILTAMQEVMGPFPQDIRRVALEVAVEEEADAGTYIRRLITYQSEPDCRTPAYLCIPKSVLQNGGQARAVLCLHPTDNSVGHKVVVGLGGRANRQYAAELAERGYITIAPAYPHLANYWPNLGGLGYVSGTMKAIWDNSRAIDLLQAMPEVDSTHGIGAIGHSLGGHNAIYTAVFDNRIQVIVSSCGFDSYSDYMDGAERVWMFGQGWCQIRYMPRMSNYRGCLNEIPFDFPELVAALAPRPFYVNAPLRDSNFRWKSVDRCTHQAGAIYELLNAKDAIIVDHPDCEHDFPDEQRQRAYQIIDAALKSKPATR